MVNPRLHTWSPVADEIAIEDIVSERKHVFYIYDLRTKTARQVAEAVSFDISGVDWTADGQEIVYSANVGGRHQLFRVSKSGGPSRQISWEMFGNLVLPQVSPDGQWVAATRSVSAREIWRMPLGSP